MEFLLLDALYHSEKLRGSIYLLYGTLITSYSPISRWYVGLNDIYLHFDTGIERKNFVLARCTIIRPS